MTCQTQDAYLVCSPTSNSPRNAGIGRTEHWGGDRHTEGSTLKIYRGLPSVSHLSTDHRRSVRKYRRLGKNHLKRGGPTNPSSTHGARVSVCFHYPKWKNLRQARHGVDYSGAYAQWWGEISPKLKAGVVPFHKV